MDLPNSGDEFSIIDRLRRRFESVGVARRPGETGIGDDAAVLCWDQSDSLVAATDLVVAGVHVDLDLCSPADVGWKALMVTVSDLAAMGARATYALLSVAAPVGFDIDGLAEGVAEASARTGCVVVGGDLSAADQVVVSVAVFGHLEDGVKQLTRGGARPGEYVVVTGPLGGSAAGLRTLRQGAAPATLATAYRRPLARWREGVVAASSGATSAIDLSDGLTADLGHLADASGVGVALDELPIADGATEHEALCGGEEYELIFTTSDVGLLAAAFRAEGLRAPVVIGQCNDQAGMITRRGRVVERSGWRHAF